MTFDSVSKSVKDGKVISHSRQLYMVPGKLRSELQEGSDSSGYVVMNTADEKMLIVDTKQKTARISSLKEGDGDDMAAKMIEAVRSIPSETGRPLGTKQIDGVQAKGFEVVQEHKTMTLWANASTGDPIRIEILHKNTANGPVSTEWTNIKLGENLNSDLFSVEPPVGLKVIPFAPIDLATSPAKFAAEFLRGYSKHMGNRFPPTLQGAWKDLAKKMEADQANQRSSEDDMQLSFQGAFVGAMTRSGKQGEHWQYYPGRTVGDAEQVVCWLRDRKNKADYWAVYGDFHVEKLTKDSLPPPPKDSAKSQ
jgi:outer membrane lipoprotein-sorting protein